MLIGYFKVPQPINEPVKAYKPGSPEREELKKKLNRVKIKTNRSTAYYWRRRSKNRQHRENGYTS